MPWGNRGLEKKEPPKFGVAKGCDQKSGNAGGIIACPLEPKAG